MTPQPIHTTPSRRLLKACAALVLLSATAGFAQAQYSIEWYTIDGGGAMIAGVGGYAFGGTIGQPDAGRVHAGRYTIIGGFWAATLQCAGYNPCDSNCDGSVNLFDVDAFVAIINTHVQCAICAGDTNIDGTVNLFDIQGLVECLSP